MRWPLVLVIAAAFAPTFAQAETSWVFRASYYSHDPASGDRVAQFAPEKPPYVRIDPTYQQSAYRHNRTSLQVGDNYDYLHIVETWGQGEQIRPYGEWLYPYRAGATPYGPWGNPQGPWTTPFGSWSNPYGLGRMPGFYWGPGGMMPNPVPGTPQIPQGTPNSGSGVSTPPPPPPPAAPNVTAPAMQ